MNKQHGSGQAHFSHTHTQIHTQTLATKEQKTFQCFRPIIANAYKNYVG